MAMESFTAYFDESETHSTVLPTGEAQEIPRDKRVVVVAGFLANVEQWERLENEWDSVFGQHDLPREAPFHMVDFAQSVGVFKPFVGKASERQRFLSQLIGLLALRVKCSIACALRLRDYDDADARLTVRETVNPYTLCALSAIRKGMRWAEHYGAAELRIVFEHGFLAAGQLLDICKRDNFPLPSFELKGKWRALQAADMVAWESQKLWKKVMGQDERSVRKSMKAIARIRSDWADYLPRNILASCEHLGCVPRGV
jgi:hypothetical protein